MLQDLYCFCSFALLLQLVLFLLYASRAAQHPHSTATVVKRVVDALIGAVPVAIPTVIILACCRAKLLRHGISVHQFLKVQLAADVEMAVFDKTGTLTGNTVGSTDLSMKCCRKEEKTRILQDFASRMVLTVASQHHARCIEPVVLPCFYHCLTRDVCYGGASYAMHQCDIDNAIRR